MWLKLICVDERYSKPYKTYFDEDAIDNFLNGIIRKKEYCFKKAKRKFNKPYVITENDHEDMKILIIILNVGFVKKHTKKI